jgi:hypothetical protein
MNLFPHPLVFLQALRSWQLRGLARDYSRPPITKNVIVGIKSVEALAPVAVSSMALEEDSHGTRLLTLEM